MLSKSKIKLINKLKTNKGRKETGLFIAEGVKIIDEIINTNIDLIDTLFYTELWLRENKNLSKIRDAIEVSDFELNKITCHSTSNSVLAILKQTNNKKFELNDYSKPIIILDEIKDPGNLGTIIRTMDWFGLNVLICSPNSVDIYNPKVIQSSMGSFLRTNIIYDDINKFIINHTKQFNSFVYGTFTDGQNINTVCINSNSLIVFGNESRGINKEIEKMIDQKISIPKSNDNSYPESLNLSISVGIICNEIIKTITR